MDWRTSVSAWKSAWMKCTGARALVDTPTTAIMQCPRYRMEIRVVFHYALSETRMEFRVSNRKTGRTSSWVNWLYWIVESDTWADLKKQFKHKTPPTSWWEC